MPRLLTRGERRRRNRLHSGRLHLGTLAGIKSERWPTSIRNRWPACFGIRIHQQNRYALHRLLARLTDYVETQSGQPSRYLDYVSQGKGRYEIEHIWADHPERHADEFTHPADFTEHRNRIGGLLLLSKSFNASYGDLSYEKKLPHYNTQNINLLARSLHPQCYEHNPGFRQFVRESGLPFKAHTQFKMADVEERGVLYRLLAERIWNPNDLLKEASI